MKKLLTLILCISMAFAMAVPAFASCGDNNGGNESNSNTYVKSLYSIAYGTSANMKQALEDFKLPANYEDNCVGGKPSGDNDFNKGCGSTSYFVRLIYSEFTSNANEAITDLVAVYKNKGESGNGKIYINNMAYYSVGGKSRRFSMGASPYITPFAAMDFNINDDDDDCTKAVYLYYTTDYRAGAPITKLNIYYDYENHTKENLVKEITTNAECNFNEGYDGGRTVYLQIERGNSSTGSVFNTTASVVTISVCVVIILGVMGFVIIKKRKGVAQ